MPKWLKRNTEIKTKNNEPCFSFEPYAQELYDLMSGYTDQLISKTLKVGDYFTIDSIDVKANGNIMVSGNEISSVTVKMSKERDFLKSILKTEEEFIDDVTLGKNTYRIKITDVNPIIKGSFQEAFKDDLLNEFYDQLHRATKIYDAKVIEKNKGGYFCHIKGVPVFLPGSLASANKIIDFDSFLGKTVKVMIDSYIPENNTYIVSNKKYIENVLPELISNLDYRNQYKGVVTGSIDSGIFIEFNDIMTGMLSPNDMSNETYLKFSNKSIKPGDTLNIWIRDIHQSKKIILTEIDPTIMINELLKIKEILKDGPVQAVAQILSNKGNFFTFRLQDTNIVTTCYINDTTKFKIRSEQIVNIIINDIEPLRNKLNISVII